MHKFTKSILSLAAPLLILLAIFGAFHREGSKKLQALPAGLVGSGLIITSALRRSRTRKKLLVGISFMKDKS